MAGEACAVGGRTQEGAKVPVEDHMLGPLQAVGRLANEVRSLAFGVFTELPPTGQQGCSPPPPELYIQGLQS